MQLLLAQLTGSLPWVNRQILRLSGIRRVQQQAAGATPTGLRSNNVLKAARNPVLSDTLT